MKRMAVVVAGTISLLGLSLSLAEADGPKYQAELIWAASDGLRHEIFSSSMEQGAWSEPVMITNDAADNLHPSIDKGPGGRKWAVWTAMEQGSIEIRYSVGSEAGWEPAKVLPSRLSSNIKPSVAVDADDVPWVVWTGNNGGYDDIYFSRFLNGSWEEEKQVNRINTVPDILPFLDMTEDNMPVVSWKSFSNGRYITLRSIWDGTSWGEEHEVTDQVEPSENQAEQNLVSLPSFIPDKQEVFLRVMEAPEK